jgi:hypothetical protein
MKIGQHLMEVIDLRLAVGVRVVDAVVDNPELVGFGIDVDAGDDPDASDHIASVAAPLTADHLHLTRAVFVPARLR